MTEIPPSGSPDTKLIVIRGNSGSGKSTIARQLQLRHGRGCAWVEQDHLRRIVLRERDEPGGIAPALIAQTVQFALNHGYHVVLEGILFTGTCGDMLTALAQAHRGHTSLFYLDVTLEETLRRHATRPQADLFGAAEMSAWYVRRDLLGLAGEHVVPEACSIEDTLALITATAEFALEHRDEAPLSADNE